MDRRVGALKSGYVAMAMGEQPVVVFLSTGRCGTQWLNAGLRELHPETDAEHEPIGPLYRPRAYFRCYSNPEAILDVPEVAAHLQRLERAERPYVETGWPQFPALPAMAARLGERLRIVHLTRHPVPTALSHAAHKSYAGSPRDDAYTRLATLGPDDGGVVQRGYSQRWELLSPYEKCLYWWTEVHNFALEFEERAAVHGVAFVRIASEEMLSGERMVLQRLLAFMGLPWNERWIERTSTIVDRWHHHSDEDVDPMAIGRHPLAVDVAHRLEYDVGTLDIDALMARYHGRPDAGLDRIGRFGSM
jgi:hypothetical protein